MLVILPFCARDKVQAVRLAEWIKTLGGVEKHDCILAIHKDTDATGVIEPLTESFLRIASFTITDEMIVEREQHAYAANVMWKRTINHVADMNESQPFLWLEPDAVPLSASWLDDIAAEYKAAGKPFLHDLVVHRGRRSNSGCGIYPAKVRDYTDRLWELSDVSWDVHLYEDFAPKTAYTKLIQDIGFLPDSETLPTFPDQASLSLLRPGAVLFHRCKDETLIDRLFESKNGVCVSGLNVSPSRDAQEPEGRIKTPPDWPEGSTPSTPVKRESELLERIARLEALLQKQEDKPVVKRAAESKSPAKAQRTKRVRTPEQIAADKARMAAVRAKKSTPVS